MIKLYLDIDGVLLHTKNTRVAECAAEFIDYVTTHFDCYWLTTHCKDELQLHNGIWQNTSLPKQWRKSGA